MSFKRLNILYSLNMQVYLCTFYRIKILFMENVHSRKNLFASSLKTQKDVQERVLSKAVSLLHER